MTSEGFDDELSEVEVEFALRLDGVRRRSELAMRKLRNQLSENMALVEREVTQKVEDLCQHVNARMEVHHSSVRERLASFREDAFGAQMRSFSSRPCVVTHSTPELDAVLFATSKLAELEGTAACLAARIADCEERLQDLVDTAGHMTRKQQLGCVSAGVLALKFMAISEEDRRKSLNALCEREDEVKRHIAGLDTGAASRVLGNQRHVRSSDDQRHVRSSNERSLKLSSRPSVVLAQVMAAATSSVQSSGGVDREPGHSVVC